MWESYLFPQRPALSFRSKQKQTTVHNCLNLTNHILFLQGHNTKRKKNNNSLPIFYMPKLQIWHRVLTKRSVTVLTSAIHKCTVKAQHKQVQTEFLKRPLVQALKPASASRSWAGLLLLESISQAVSIFQLEFPLQTKHEVLRSEWLEYETDVILHFLKHLLIVRSL